jgi:hypothetical protein
LKTYNLPFEEVSALAKWTVVSLLATFSKADARDVDSGEPTPEAPRTIFDLWATVQELPFRLQAREEFAYVGTKPLGTACSPDPINRRLPTCSVKGCSIQHT